MSSLDVKLHFRRLSAVIAAMSDIAGGTGHAGTTGRIREQIVSKFLRPHLPETLSLRSGVIIDAIGGKSKQQDCIIVDTRLPVIDVGDAQDAVLIAESVVATVEVKSFLSTNELNKTLDAVALTKQLIRTGIQTYKKGPAELQIDPARPILTYVFAYDGAELSTLFQSMGDFARERNDGGLLPDAVCLLRKGLIERSPMMPVVRGDHVILPRMTDTQLIMSPLAKDSLLSFYRRLIDDVVPLSLVNYDIDAYYSSSDLE